MNFADESRTDGSMKLLETYVPWGILAVAVLYLVMAAIPPSVKPNERDVQAIETIPILEEGRIKPLDSLARVSLMSISSRSEFKDTDGKMKPAINWLLDVMASPNELSGPAADHKVFRIENDQVLSFLELENRPGSYRYSFREIVTPETKFKVGAEFARVSEKDSKKQNIYEQKIAELSRKVRTYQDLLRHKVPMAIPPQREGDQWYSLLEIDEQIVRPARKGIQRHVEEEVGKKRLKMLEEIQKEVVNEYTARGYDVSAFTEEEKRAVAKEISDRLDADTEMAIMRGVEQLSVEYANKFREDYSPAAAAFLRMLHAWEARSPGDFNQAVREYKEKYLKLVPESDVDKAKLETIYNHFEPFYLCGALFILAFVLGCSSWLGWTEPLNRSSTLVCLLALVVHSAAMIVRIYLQGRPPVTNLFSSALFIGWGGVGFCLIMERYYHNGIGNVVGSFLGFATMIIAHHLGMGEDTFKKLDAVLNTNFWLATHVTTVTLGYTATFIAGFIGVLYILRGIFTKSLDPTANRTMSSMLYGILCFATLLSFVGTVLGGIWADQSWGRFWGWDPKENGAVLIVLWNALILHARWSGIVRQRGIAVLALVGNIITAWSWFGTNQLQTGLHSYGFDSSLAKGCRYFWMSQLALIAIGLLPLRYWRSFSPDTIAERAEQTREAAQAKRERGDVKTGGKGSPGR